VIVVVGADGQLGSAFRRRLGESATYLTRVDLDLRNTGDISDLMTRLRPAVVINCAAYTAVDAAETDAETAYAVNATAVGAMAEATANLDARFVTLSTDYVFDGTSREPYHESSTPNPVNVYGETKLAGETLALGRNERTLVVRTSWVLSGTHPNFVATMLRLARDREVSVVDDQWGNPTLVDDLAPAIVTALERGATGVLHLTNEGSTSWYGLARQSVEIAGGDPERITPCTSADYPTPARRPMNSILVSERLEEIGLAPMPPYRRALERAVAQLVANDLV